MENGGWIMILIGLVILLLFAAAYFGDLLGYAST